MGEGEWWMENGGGRMRDGLWVCRMGHEEWDSKNGSENEK